MKRGAELLSRAVVSTLPMLAGVAQTVSTIRHAPRERPYEPSPWLRSRGRYTYGEPHIRGWAANPHFVDLGSFCSIARDVVIQTGGNHHIEWATSFPLRERLMLPGVGEDGHPVSKGDVIVGDDVWIGEGAMIMSGVSVGTGAVVAARSVVAHDVAPYTIVAGVPAREVAARFPAEAANAVAASRWWTWPRNVVEQGVELLPAPPGPELVSLAEDVAAARSGQAEGRRFHHGRDVWSDPVYTTVASDGFRWNYVCVVMACFNHAQYVAEAIGSIEDQTYKNLTLIITDDDSPDGTASVAADCLRGSTIRSWAVVRRTSNAGLPTILNDVLQTTQSPMFAFLGGDDLWEKDKLRLQVGRFRREEGAGAIVTDANRIGNATGTQFGRYQYSPRDELVSMRDLVTDYPIAACTPLYATAYLRLVGGWDTNLSYEDQGMMLKLADFSRLPAISQKLASHRYHATTSSHLHAERHLASRYQLLCKWLGRDPELDHMINLALSSIVMTLYLHFDPETARPLVADLVQRAPDRRTRTVEALIRRGYGPSTRAARIGLRLSELGGQ